MKKQVFVWLILLTLLLTQGGFAQIDLSALPGKRIGVQTGTTFDAIVLEAIPDAQISYFNSYPDLAAALQSGKIDAFPGDEAVLRLMSAENDRLRILDGRMTSFDVGFVLPKSDRGEKLKDELDAWLGGIRDSGELDGILHKWISGPESEKTVPDYASLPASNGTLTMATEGGYVPMCYFRGGTLVGIEIDLAARFCQARGYGLIVENMNFDGVLPAVQSGKADFAAAGISITEERRESVDFSVPYYTGGTVMAVLRTPEAQSRAGLPSLEDMRTKRIGIPSGTSFDLLIRTAFPDAQLTYYNNQSDLLTALAAGKIDAFPSNEPVVRYMISQGYEGIDYIPEFIQDFDSAYCFSKDGKGQKLCGEFSEFLRSLRQDGGMDRLAEKWFSTDEKSKTIPDYRAFPAEKGTLVMATDGDYMPFEYIREGEVVGYDVDIAAQFCQARGYGLKIEVMNLDAVLPAVESGKCDFVGSAITITPERAESVLFSEPNYSGGVVLVVRSAEEPRTASFWSGIRNSFDKTFIREERWHLFAQGVANTLLITLLSLLCGTALGFGVYMLCRNGNPVANGVTRVAMWLVQGTPMVVLLMILFYIVFGKASVSGILVAVIGFTLTFGSAVFGLLKMGVGAVDAGQTEAAYALGYSNRRTFFTIILPQALPHVMSAYSGEVVGLIKSTAIVGYIAVQDLTKMGDIVRSRTYEAFFPLIAVTVIYFVLEGLLEIAVEVIRKRLNPRRRGPKDILKGVRTDD